MHGAKFLGETFLRVFSNNLWFSRENCDFRTRFTSGWLKLYSSCPENQFQGKSICLIYFFSILSGHRAEKTSFFGENFSIKLLKCILRVQRKTLRKTVFPTKTVSCHHFCNSKKKLFETSWQNSQKKFVYTYLDVLVGTLQLIFFEEIMFLFITLELVRRNFKIHKKTFRQRFQKCIRRFLRNVFRISVVFFERNCEVSSIFDSETKLFQNFVSKLRQSGHNRNLPVELKALTESSIF